ncbi:MAG: CotH kinase family protein [Deltaproteobacteria bacterium]|nr:CotH kinase family protein [Deltaproteobacteria bacterium]
MTGPGPKVIGADGAREGAGGRKTSSIFLAGVFVWLITPSVPVILRPAFFWADGEPQLLVGVRRKKALALNAAPDFSKVSLKVDVNEFVSGQKWHELTKLSLENGDDDNVLSEGFSWQMHRLAHGPQGYGYNAGLANWVVVTINGVNTGVYVHVEQRNKQVLRNRGLYTADQTWLYKKSGIGPATVVVAGIGPDPTDEALCYSPFQQNNPTCCWRVRMWTCILWSVR